ncbi:MAG TPA: folate-binding protein [Rudaea sp.]
MLIELPSPQVIDLSGADADAFAQAQFSSDLRALGSDQWQFSAWLSAQGRVRALFHLLRLAPDRLRLILRGGSAAMLRDALARYVLRSKVSIAVASAVRVIGVESPAAVAEIAATLPVHFDFTRVDRGVLLALPFAPARWLLVQDSNERATPTDATEAAVARWRAADIAAGLPEIDASLDDRLLPAWLAFERLGAASTKKGCYPGQEIVARMHFKGGNKRWLHRLAFAGPALPPPGTLLSGSDGRSATLVSAAMTGAEAGVALAVIEEVPAGTALHGPDARGVFEVLERVG